MQNFTDKNFTFAIAGASNNPEKYGNIVMKDLLDAGYKVIPVNPHEKEILGQKVYEKVDQIREKIDTVIFVVPPEVSMQILNEMEDLNHKFWFQPGSESEEVLNFCKEKGLDCVHNACIMVARKK